MLPAWATNATAKLIGAGLILAGLLAALAITRHTLAQARAWEDQVLTAARAAGGNPRLARAAVPAQIDALGRAKATLADGLDRCTASARAAAENDARRQQEATRRLQEAEARAETARSAADRFRASAAAPRTPETQCAPSDTVRERWPS